MTAALQGCALQGSLWDVGEEAGLRELGGVGAPHRAQPRRLAGPAPGVGDRVRRAVRAAWSTTCRGTPSAGRCTSGSSTSPGCSASTARASRCPTRCSSRPATTLTRHYAAELGEPFVTAGLCLYRDGRDSVAWHGDTIGRGRTEDTMVAILSLGRPAPLLLRPRGGGRDAALTSSATATSW